MSKLRLQISLSRDGFVAGPDQSVENPIGVGGMRLHQWIFPLTAWRAMHGLEGGEATASTPVIEETLANIGAPGLALVKTVQGAGVVHLKFVRP
jgi:hypothetical protein